MRHLDETVARAALARWGGDPSTLRHVATSGNAVYRFREGATPRILRLTDPEHRTAEQNHAEMEFLLHLRACGVRANAPVPSASGKRVERLEGCSACVLSWAPGVRVEPASEHWNEGFFKEWGRSLGRIHSAARSYRGPSRWEWTDEGLLAHARRLIPADDAIARVELEDVLARLLALPRRADNYGMNHADFAPQNFNYDPAAGITGFDFGNCCAHWFVSDLVISLSTLRRQSERERYRAWLLAGYREAMAIDDEIWVERSWFLRLRVLYVYLSRLAKFGSNPTAEQRATLDMLRGLVAERLTWE